MSDNLCDEVNGQFVYIYRNKGGNPLYVGRGRHIARSQSHTGNRAHNNELTAALATEKVFAIEIAGPFGTKENAAMVEAALISAFNLTPILGRALTNKNEGISSANFRPLGVPDEFAERAVLPPLDVTEIGALTSNRPALFVLVRDSMLSDGRAGVDLANPPRNEDIQTRMVCWWQLRKYMEFWGANPTEIPSILIAVSGSLKHRIVVGSLAIDDEPGNIPWKARKPGSAQRQVRVKPDEKLDCKGIRGRRVASSIVTFGQGKHDHFRIVGGTKTNSVLQIVEGFGS